MTHDILKQMAFSLEVLERDARSLNMTLLAQILSMATVELAEIRKQPAFAASDSRKKEKVAETAQGPMVVGSWRWDLTCDRITFDPEVARLVGVEQEVAASGVPLAILIDAVHVIDKARVAETFARAASHDEPLHFVFRIKTPEGATRRMFAVGRAVFENGRAVCVPGTLIDVTDEAQDDVRAPKSAMVGIDALPSGRSRPNKAWVL